MDAAFTPPAPPAQQPSPGRIVLFNSIDGRVYPAVVVSIGDLPGCANLGVFAETYRYEANIPCDVTGEALGTWRWPPRL
jgi:hypothetical protein